MKFQFAIGLSVTLLCSGFIQASNNKSLIIEGYASNCYMFLVSGSPTIRVNIFPDPESAKADNEGGRSKAPPVANLLVDLGPGYQLSQIYPDSMTLKICAIIDKNEGSKKLRFGSDKGQVLRWIKTDNETAESDAYILMSTQQQKLVSSLVRAYLHSEDKAYKCQHDKIEDKGSVVESQ